MGPTVNQLRSDDPRVTWESLWVPDAAVDPEASPPPGLVSMPGQQISLGSERGLATPSPDGKGEITLSPSPKIMPVES